jgi:hypothetical protein
MAFDPDAYAADTPGGFDPDAYLSEVKTIPSHRRGEDVREITPGGMALGGLEGLAAVGSSALAYPAGLGAAAIQLARGKGMAGARPQRALVQDALTYSPRTDEGKGFVGAVGRLMAPWTKSAEYVGRKVGEATGMPTLGGMAEEGFGAVVNPLAAVGMTKGLKPQKVLEAPRIAETPAAALLRSHGVDNLTTGQRAGPGTFLGQAEAAAEKNWQGLLTQREAALRKANVQAVQHAVKGGNAPLPDDLPRSLGDARQMLSGEYAAMDKKPVPSHAAAGVYDAPNVPQPAIPDSMRAAVQSEATDALTSLPHAPLTVGDLQNTRSLMRESRVAATAAGDARKVAALRRGEELVTKGINDSLTPAEAAELAAIDRRFAMLETIEGAIPSGGDAFTGRQLLRSNQKAVGPRAAKEGRGGPLQAYGQAMEDVFAPAPPTGWGGRVLDSMPLGDKLIGPLSRALNARAAQRFLFDPRTRLELTGSPEAAPLSLSAAMARAMEARNETLAPRLRLQLAAAHEQEGQ